MFEDCGNCIAMEQSGYISEWQNLLLTLTIVFDTFLEAGGLFMKKDIYHFLQLYWQVYLLLAVLLAVGKWMKLQVEK